MGKKEVEYKVVLNSKNEEISREVIKETIISNPVEKVEKIGISDYNLNTNIRTMTSECGFCSEDGVIYMDDYISGCDDYDNNGIYVEDVSIDDVFVSLRKITGEYPNYNYENITNYSTFDYKIKEYDSFGLIINGTKYYMLGCQGSFETLNDDMCNVYNLACGRW